MPSVGVPYRIGCVSASPKGAFTIGSRLQDLATIITGGASGIGRSTVLSCAREGARVLAADRNARGLEETQTMAKDEGLSVVTFTVDVSKADMVSGMVERALTDFGRLDVLVNAAGTLMRTPAVAEVTERDWDLMMSTNLKGPFLCIRAAVPTMIQNGGGAIVNISSMAGVQGASASVPYSIAKAGLIHLTTVTANQYTSLGIRINCIAPGPVDTPQSRGGTQSAEALAELGELHPMGRIGQPEEIASVIVFLASSEASYMSGHTLIVDGGLWTVSRG